MVEPPLGMKQLRTRVSTRANDAENVIGVVVKLKGIESDLFQMSIVNAAFTYQTFFIVPNMHICA